MPSFRFKAISAGGEVTTGVMDAPSERAVVEKLRRQGSIPIRAEPADSARAALPGLLNLRLSRRSGLSRQEIAGFTRELAIMLGAGQDLDRALRFLVETAPNARVKGVLGTLRDDSGKVRRTLLRDERAGWLREGRNFRIMPARAKAAVD